MPYMFRFWTVQYNLKGICFQSPFLFEYTILSSNWWLWDWPLQRQELPGSCCSQEGWIELGRADTCKLKQPLFCQDFMGVHKAHREKLITLVTLNFLNVTRGKGSHLVCFWLPYEERAYQQGLCSLSIHTYRHIGPSYMECCRKTEARGVTHLVQGHTTNWW